MQELIEKSVKGLVEVALLPARSWRMFTASRKCPGTTPQGTRADDQLVFLLSTAIPFMPRRARASRTLTRWPGMRVRCRCRAVCANEVQHGNGESEQGQLGVKSRDRGQAGVDLLSWSMTSGVKGRNYQECSSIHLSSRKAL